MLLESPRLKDILCVIMFTKQNVLKQVMSANTVQREGFSQRFVAEIDEESENTVVGFHPYFLHDNIILSNLRLRKFLIG